MSLRFALVPFFAVSLTLPAVAQDVPPGVQDMLNCASVYSMKSEDAKANGDEGAATEFFHMGDNLLWQARATLEGAGFAAEIIEDMEMNTALVTGFRYGAGEDVAMLEECLAAADSP